MAIIGLSPRSGSNWSGGDPSRCGTWNLLGRSPDDIQVTEVIALAGGSSRAALAFGQKCGSLEGLAANPRGIEQRRSATKKDA
jgi:hypothetical protein